MLSSILLLLQVVSRNEQRSKRDVNDAITSSDESDNGSDESDSSSDAAIDECALLRNYLDFKLPAVPEFRIDLLYDPPSPLTIQVVNETAPTFLELLTSAPSLFANITQAIDDSATGQGNFPGYSEFYALAADFVAVANDSCGISLSPGQIADVTRLFYVALPTYFLASHDCHLLNKTIVEAIVAASDGGPNPFDFSNEFHVYRAFVMSGRISRGIHKVLDSPADQIVAAAQFVLDEFLFIVNDVCGIPTLSDVTLAQLNEYFLVDVVNFAMRQ